MRVLRIGGKMIGIGRNFLVGPLSLIALTAVALGFPVDTAQPTITREKAEIRAKAEQGFVKQEIEIADAYFIGDGVPQDFAEAAHWYEKAASAGDPGAQNQTGYLYQAGIGVTRDPTRAAHWYQLAASGGLVQATVNLGILYLRGLGVSRDPAAAQQLLEEALRRGCGTAGAHLGDIYYYGLGVPEDREAGERWYEAGAKLHDPMAEYRVASLYSIIEGHAHDLHKAVNLLHSSSEKGFVPAIYSLGLILVNHPELAKSSGEALPLLQAAANAGTWRASAVLGTLSRDGKGVPQDVRDAYFHFQVAVQQGGPEALLFLAYDLKLLEAKLDPAALQELSASAESTAAQHHIQLLYINADNKKGNNRRHHYPMIAIAVAPPEISAGLLIPAARD